MIACSRFRMPLPLEHGEVRPVLLFVKILLQGSESR